MRISDWSSDVCSSDLADPRDRQGLDAVARLQRPVAMGFQKVVEQLHIELVVLDDGHCLRHTTSSEHAGRPTRPVRCPLQSRREAARDDRGNDSIRSEARSVGKEWVSTGRSRWSAYPSKKKKVQAT